MPQHAFNTAWAAAAIMCWQHVVIAVLPACLQELDAQLLQKHAANTASWKTAAIVCSQHVLYSACAALPAKVATLRCRLAGA
jgi:hypothetical protein